MRFYALVFSSALRLALYRFGTHRRILAPEASGIA
jgi:hypothetical protein